MKLDAERRDRMKDALIAVAEGMAVFGEETRDARSAGEISQQAADALGMLGTAVLLNITQIVEGLYVNFADKQQNEVTVPVPDSELPDWNLVTTDVPDN